MVSGALAHDEHRMRASASRLVRYCGLQRVFSEASTLDRPGVSLPGFGVDLDFGVNGVLFDFRACHSTLANYTNYMFSVSASERFPQGGGALTGVLGSVTVCRESAAPQRI